MSAIERARARAEENLRENEAPQARAIGLLRQVAHVTQTVRDPAGAEYLTMLGPHGAGFRIVAVVGTDGTIGWAVV